MAYHVYKCNHVPANGPDSGDWAYVFAKSPDSNWRRKDGVGWGRYVDHRELAKLKRGDVVIALQTGAQKRLVGLAEYVGDTGSGASRRAKFRPLELIDVKIPPLKKADPKGVGSIDALQGGKQRTLYDITSADAKLLLRVARQAKKAADTDAATKAAEGVVPLEKKVAVVGAGFGDFETNRKVERAAVRAVTRRLRDEGWEVRSVELAKLGYDLDCRRGPERAHVEVKGVRGMKTQFFITAAEVACWRKDPACRIAVVTSALRKPTIEFFTRAALDKFRFVDVLYRASRK